MKFKNVKPNETLLKATAPENVTRLVFDEDKETMILAGFDGDQVICYAVFYRVPAEGHEVKLIYIYTVPDRRDEGCCSALLEESKRILATVDIDYITMRQIVEYEDAAEYNSFYTKRGFLPMNLTGRLLEYRLSDMLDAGVFQTIVKNRKKLPQVYDIKTIGDMRLKTMLTHARMNGFSFAMDASIMPYSRFYIGNDEIDGALIASKPDEDTLYVSSVYLENETEDKNLFLVLFSECVYAAFRDDLDKEFRILIIVDSDEVYQGLLNIYNPPDEECAVLEYIMPIAAKGGKN